MSVPVRAFEKDGEKGAAAEYWMKGKAFEEAM